MKTTVSRAAQPCAGGVARTSSPSSSRCRVSVAPTASVTKGDTQCRESTRSRRDLRPRRRGLGCRAARDGLHVHRGADLAPRRAGSLLLRHAGGHPPEGDARRSGHRGSQPVVQVQRDDTRPGSQPARLRARHELARSRADRRRSGDPRVPLAGQVPEQPERRDDPLRRDDLLLRPVVRPLPRLRDRACPRARVAGRLPYSARRRSGRARSRGRRGRVRDAERALLLARREADVHQRHPECLHQGLRRQRRRHALELGACSSRASAPA